MLKEALSDAIPRILVLSIREAVATVLVLSTFVHRLNKLRTCVDFRKNNRSPGAAQTIRRCINLETTETCLILERGAHFGFVSADKFVSAGQIHSCVVTSKY